MIFNDAAKTELPGVVKAFDEQQVTVDFIIIRWLEDPGLEVEIIDVQPVVRPVAAPFREGGGKVHSSNHRVAHETAMQIKLANFAASAPAWIAPSVITTCPDVFWPADLRVTRW